MINFITDNGIVINKNDFGEADRYVTVFTENFGKIVFFIKGIRKSKKREVSAVDILTLSKFTFYKKKESYMVSTLQSIDSYSEIKGDLENLGLSLYMLSVLNTVLVENNRKKRLYKITLKSFEYLKKSSDRKNNFSLIAYYLHYIIRDEGLRINKGEGFNFSFEKSGFVKENEHFSLKVSPEQREIVIKIIEGKVKEIIRGKYLVENIIRAILLFEKYLNFQFGIELKLKNYIMGVEND
ncbi:DNA repair protein RecO [Fusobacterium sp.]|uniref:DNA repair protein RecO n=1 Tax=Fusobacterium sp. TaxID=68766 RepID=UPI00396CDA80